MAHVLGRNQSSLSNLDLLASTKQPEEGIFINVINKEIRKKYYWISCWIVLTFNKPVKERFGNSTLTLNVDITRVLSPALPFVLQYKKKIKKKKKIFYP